MQRVKKERIFFASKLAKKVERWWICERLGYLKVGKYLSKYLNVSTKGKGLNTWQVEPKYLTGLVEAGE